MCANLGSIMRGALSYVGLSLRDFPRRGHVGINEYHARLAIDWIKHAQDVAGDGGVPGMYTLGKGWEPSYPETTGYIIPTMFDYYWYSHDDDCKNRAVKMGEWLVSVQCENGAFKDQSGNPFIFDTGQAVQGLVRAYNETRSEKYLSSAIEAGDFLVHMQDADGAWRRFVYNGVVQIYNAQVAWNLLELFLVTRDDMYRDSAFRSIRFAIENQRSNGWFQHCAFDDQSNPLTHTIAYATRGILECAALLHNDNYLAAAMKTADALLKLFNTDGYLRARYDQDWKSTGTYSCLTGDAQISLIWLRMFEISRNPEYLLHARRLNAYLRTVHGKHVSSSNAGVRGAIAGSDPIYGKYMPFSFPNWATKFFVDALLLESKLGTV